MLRILFLLCFSLSLYSNPHLIKYKQKIKEWQIPQWMIDQIESDFLPYQKRGFNKNSLEAAVNTQFSFSRLYKIKEGSLYPAPNYDKTQVAESLINEAHQKWVLPEIDIVLNQMDGIKAVSGDTTKRGPILTIAKDKTIKGVVLLYTYDPANKQTFSDIESDMSPWNEKIEKVIWRGSSTDGIDGWGCNSYDKANWKTFPRGALVNLSNQYPDLIDAKFTGFYCYTPDYMKDFFYKKGVVGNFLSRRDQINYKYQVSPDGNVCTYPGLQWRLYSGCLLFKPKSNHLQWFENGLQPYVHYIPVNNDFSDLVDKINWAKNNDEEAELIAQNARKFAQTFITYDMNLKYLYLVLLRYASLYKGTK